MRTSQQPDQSSYTTDYRNSYDRKGITADMTDGEDRTPFEDWSIGVMSLISISLIIGALMGYEPALYVFFLAGVVAAVIIVPLLVGKMIYKIMDMRREL